MRSLTKNEAIAVSAAIGVIILFFGARFMMTGGTVESAVSDTITKSATNQSAQSATTLTNTMDQSTAGQLKITDVKVGTGATAKAGDTISVLYTGKFEDGTVFDASSKHGGQPIQFTLGAGQVIKGWDMGFDGMKVGGKRNLVIPSDLGYGANDYGPIPGGSTLIFDIELVGIK